MLVCRRHVVMTDTNDDDWTVPYPDAVTDRPGGFPDDDRELEMGEGAGTERWKVEYPDA